MVIVNQPRKTVRLIDVAEKAGVSRSAVGHVLLGTGAGAIRVGDATAEQIRLIAAELGYHPNRAAQQLRGASTQTLGVLMDTVNATPGDPPHIGAASCERLTFNGDQLVSCIPAASHDAVHQRLRRS